MRVELYGQLARRTVAPAGQMWDAGVTSVAFAAETEVMPEMRSMALAFWDALTAPPHRREAQAQ